MRTTFKPLGSEHTGGDSIEREFYVHQCTPISGIPYENASFRQRTAESAGKQRHATDRADLFPIH